MNKLSTEDAETLCEALYNKIQDAPRRMKGQEIEEAVTMAFKRAMGLTVSVHFQKEYPDDERPKPIRVFSIGKDPEDAIHRFFLDNQGGEKVVIKEPLEGNKEEFPWGFYITVDGTGCKAAGTYISGYAVLTWWK